jgi:hypothetical protein
VASTRPSAAPANARVSGLPPGVPAVPPVCTAARAPIVIGTVGEQSGPLGAALIGGVRAVQAWVAVLQPCRSRRVAV